MSSEAQFETTWADSVPEKGKGFKPFHRWRHFAEKRWAYPGATTAFKSDAVWEETSLERAGRKARLTPNPNVWARATPNRMPLVGGAGRTNRVVVSPADTAHWLVCAPSGGLWNTFDSGQTWSLMGTSDWAGMGASDVAIDALDPNHVLVATGDADFGSAYGVGVLETFDGGMTWDTTGLNVQLSQNHTVSRIHFMQDAPGTLLAATSDGIWLSQDQGHTFTPTLMGLCSDLIPHPEDPQVWHAALRPGSIHRSADGGHTWNAVSGLPNPLTISRITLSASASAPHEVWAIAAKSNTQGLEGLYHSVDSGATYVKLDNVPNLLGWTVNGADLGGQGFYDLSLAVNPSDPQHIIVGGVNLWSTHDGGATWSCSGHWFGADSVPEVHADHHALTFIPGSSDVLSANDGGVARIREGRIEDLSEGLNIGQVYHIGLSEHKREHIISGWQDNGVNLLNPDEHARVLGADGFHCMVSPLEPSTLYAAEYYGKTYRSNDDGWSWSEWIQSNGTGVNERGDWDTPMAISPSDPTQIFVAKKRVYWTQDDGVTWAQTNALPGQPIEVLALSASEDSSLVVAKGTFAFRTDNLENWTPLVHLPNLPVTDALIHNEHDSTFWISFGGYDASQRISVTHDAGQTWSEEGSGLPGLPVNTLARDTITSDLYAGTDAGVYVLPSGENTWTPYKSGLPEVLCSDLVLRYNTGEILLATYGRGIWKAPLYNAPARDGALLKIDGATELDCGSPLRVRVKLRNAGTDTLVSASVSWNETDTLDYGFVLPPNESVWLPWPQVLPSQLPWNAPLQARLLNIVSLNGTLTNGDLTDGADAVSENDITTAPWRHTSHSGPVIFETTADCFPLQSAWVILDSALTETHRRQHFMPETVTTDTLCMTHGCHTVVLHDSGGDGFSGAPCGAEGDLSVQSVSGETIWALSDPAEPPVDFGTNGMQVLCFPVQGTHGCNDPVACNFNPIADIQDGSCNYDCANPNCPGDFNNDGQLGAIDILAVLAQYGCTSFCTGDMTGDGAVTAYDILAVLALYGTTCSE